MKKHIYLALILITTISSNAQSPVYNLGTQRLNERYPEKSYFKDLDGKLNGYDGTYIYTNGNTSFTISLKKKEMSYRYYYEDLIVGEFQFIEDGVELHNSLSNINVNYIDESVNHLISGSFIITGTHLGCPDCSPTEKRLRLGYIDPRSRSILGIDIRKTTVNGVPAIIARIFSYGDYRLVPRENPGPEQLPHVIKVGSEFLMIKQ